jgi:hypothetical protein
MRRLPPVSQSSEVLQIMALPDRESFVRNAYRVLAGRDATHAEVRRQVNLLTWVPFYTRRYLARRLRRQGGQPTCAS